MVPADKAKKFNRSMSVIELQIARELREQGSCIQARRVTSYYCISCAVHMGKLHVWDSSQRKPISKRLPPTAKWKNRRYSLVIGLVTLCASRRGSLQEH
ncbi:MAG: hypothetical protein EAX81_06800 [Candidatus Thorarchaeota archaeon]|nr:hypothetical protein [Candidatus Thorarchaeota archaeon]